MYFLLTQIALPLPTSAYCTATISFVHCVHSTRGVKSVQPHASTRVAGCSTIRSAPTPTRTPTASKTCWRPPSLQVRPTSIRFKCCCEVRHFTCASSSRTDALLMSLNGTSGDSDRFLIPLCLHVTASSFNACHGR